MKSLNFVDFKHYNEGERILRKSPYLLFQTRALLFYPCRFDINVASLGTIKLNLPSLNEA